MSRAVDRLVDAIAARLGGIKSDDDQCMKEFERWYQGMGSKLDWNDLRTEYAFRCWEGGWAAGIAACDAHWKPLHAAKNAQIEQLKNRLGRLHV